MNGADPFPGPGAEAEQDAWRARRDARVEAMRDAVLASVRAGDDLGDLLSLALGAAADQLGSVGALVAGRPGSWEAQHVRHLAEQYAATQDGYGGP